MRARRPPVRPIVQRSIVRAAADVDGNFTRAPPSGGAYILHRRRCVSEAQLRRLEHETDRASVGIGCWSPVRHKTCRSTAEGYPDTQNRSRMKPFAANEA